jgi:hypothetical protein
MDIARCMTLAEYWMDKVFLPVCGKALGGILEFTGHSLELSIAQSVQQTNYKLYGQVSNSQQKRMH